MVVPLSALVFHARLVAAKWSGPRAVLDKVGDDIVDALLVHSSYCTQRLDGGVGHRVNAILPAGSSFFTENAA
jgi:hypothetical protein